MGCKILIRFLYIDIIDLRYPLCLPSVPFLFLILRPHLRYSFNSRKMKRRRGCCERGILNNCGSSWPSFLSLAQVTTGRYQRKYARTSSNCKFGQIILLNFLRFLFTAVKPYGFWNDVNNQKDVLVGIAEELGIKQVCPRIMRIFPSHFQSARGLVSRE